jgi:wobble nucleotide-excising tRNase
MIRKVHRITSFGAFHNFTWPTGLHEFKKFNLFFGWNYSGKTTFSRTFRCFELQQRHVDFGQAEVHLHCEGDIVHTLSTSTGPHYYRVFNVDFVRDNIRFDEGQTEPILILGATDIAKQDALRQRQEQLTTVCLTIQNDSGAARSISQSLDRALTNAARDGIKLRLQRPVYDKRHLQLKVEACKDDPGAHKLSDAEHSRLLDIYSSKDKKPEIAAILPNGLLSLSDFAQRVKEVSTRSVKSTTIQAVAENPVLESWVNQGRSLHEGRDACQFCGGPLPSHLLSQLADHFSTEYDALMADLEKLKQDLERARSQATPTPQPAAFYADVGNSFEPLAQQLNSLMETRRTDIDTLLAAVISKQTKAFAPCNAPEVEDNADAIGTCLAAMGDLIVAHNARSQTFDSNREKAFAQLELHCAACFVEDQDYTTKLLEAKELGDTITEQNILKLSLENEIAQLQSELSEAVKGAATINELMRAYFGKDDLRITVAEDQSFRITRNGVLAKNLSEGERSAVAFVHFMTSLLDEKHPLSQTTVIVDDPIGSLDANHLFNAYAFVKTKLAHCYQLFVLTHNYEFYSLVKEWALDDEKNVKEKPQTSWHKWSIYLVRRKDDGTSTVETIPRELLRYKSEYHYLFATLLKFQTATGTDFDQLFSLPNVARRFMEAFGGIMIPKYQGLPSKLPRLIADPIQRERVWKFINDYSHNTTLNRSLLIPDTSECKVVVAACLKAVEDWNPTYYSDLLEAVQ